MAVLYITEYSRMATAIEVSGGTVQAPAVASIQAEQSLAITATSAPSSPFQPNTSFVLVNCDTACSLAFSPNAIDPAYPPVAVTTAHRLSANESRFYGVPKGGALAVILNT